MNKKNMDYVCWWIGIDPWNPLKAAFYFFNKGELKRNGKEIQEQISAENDGYV